MVKSSTAQKIFILISLLVIFIGCTKKTKKISFNDIDTLYNEKDEIIIQSILAEEENEFFKYKIRIPKVTDGRTENNSIKTFNDEIESYANEIVTNLESATQNTKQDSKKPTLNIDYEIYHGYDIYTIIVSATQVINDTSITNHRSYYISNNGDYIYNIDEIINTEEAFPYFTQRIKEQIEKTYPNKLLFDLQQAVIYFENKKIIIKFPLYVFNLDDTENTENMFEFNEEEVKKYIKQG
ncbi:Hypothetical protein BHO_0092800 [Borrelia hermsii YBT]|uniref:hypothetical protein n=1 Tax=Borrelia hermsii TaxID=140 RepID=UPI0003E38629|nr:hypothetical protein [Borrelia hermsii]AHH12242.1 Hypothetical protein BHO_0092800 [Borrelia hermsii YBT]